MEHEANAKKGVILEVIKAIIVALIISLAAILLMALFIKILNIPTSAISIINQIIKGVSILVSCLICIKIKNNGWLKGLIIGLLYIMLAFLVFSLLDQNFSIGLSLLNDIALGAITGMVSGIICVAIKK